MLKTLCAQSGALVKFDRDNDDRNTAECTAHVEGTTEQINHVTQLITDLVYKEVPTAVTSNKVQMRVPADRVGLVIGKGGEQIKQIIAETGAQIDLDRNNPPNDYEKIFYISGSQTQITRAQNLILATIEGEESNDRGGSSSRGGGGYAARNISTSHYNSGRSGSVAANCPVISGQNDMASTTHSSYVDPSAWAHYYGQQQQQSAYTVGTQSYSTVAATNAASAVPHQSSTGGGEAYQVHQQSSELGGSNSDTVYTDPQTGQVDYSLQWIQYYRTIGMNEEADKVEQQWKQRQKNMAVMASNDGAGEGGFCKLEEKEVAVKKE